jgi:hypothetical protein
MKKHSTGGIAVKLAIFDKTVRKAVGWFVGLKINAALRWRTLCGRKARIGNN